MTDKELIRRFQNGERKAFDDLVKRHYPKSYQFFFRLVQDPMEADDLCQETYIRVHRGLKGFRFESEFTTWLHRVSVNVANSHFRKQKIRNTFFSQADPDRIPTDQEPSEDFVPGLWRAIGKLSKKQRGAVILRVFQGLPFKEVAAVLGISENSAKVNFHHALKNLREFLGE